MSWFLDVLENHWPPWIRELEKSSALHSSRDTRITVSAIKTTFPLRIRAQRDLYIKQQSQKYRLETEQAHPLIIALVAAMAASHPGPAFNGKWAAPAWTFGGRAVQVSSGEDEIGPQKKSDPE